MADFIYQEPFPVGEDKTKYRLLTKEYVKVVECDGRKILKVDPKGLELLSKEAYADVSFYLRAAHLQKLRNILEDPEATDNDKFVAYTMLLNQTVSAEGEPVSYTHLDVYKRQANILSCGRGSTVWSAPGPCATR